MGWELEDGSWKKSQPTSNYFNCDLNAIVIFIRLKQSLYNLLNTSSVIYPLLFALYKQVTTSARSYRVS